MTAWWDSLSDDELELRLQQRGLDWPEAEHLVRFRDTGDADRIIEGVLDPD